MILSKRRNRLSETMKSSLLLEKSSRQGFCKPRPASEPLLSFFYFVKLVFRLEEGWSGVLSLARPLVTWLQKKWAARGISVMRPESYCCFHNAKSRSAFRPSSGCLPALRQSLCMRGQRVQSTGQSARTKLWRLLWLVYS